MSDEDQQSANRGVPPWMVTFADLMALMMTFFVLLYSFSKVDEEKYRSIVNSMAQGFDGVQWIKRHLTSKSRVGPEPGIIELPTPTLRPPPIPADSRREQPAADKNKAAFSRLNQDLSAEIAAKVIAVEQRGSDLIVRFPEKVSFPSGSDVLTERISPILYRVGHILKSSEGTIMVSGHTDDRPIATPRFRSNWELSAARAIAVAHFLMEGIGLDKSRIIVAGHADTRPLARNDSTDNRAKNRRVEVRVIRTKTAN